MSIFQSIGNILNPKNRFDFVKNLTNKILSNTPSALQEDAQSFNAEQAELDRQFQSNEAEKARNFNSIGEQAKRAREAGINMYSANGGFTNASTSSASGANAQSGISGGGFNPLDVLVSIPNLLNGFKTINKTQAETSALKQVALNNSAQAREHNANASLIEGTTQNNIDLKSKELESLKLTNRYKELSNEAQEISNSFLADMQQSVINLNVASADTQRSQTELNVEKGITEHSQRKYLESQFKLNSAMYDNTLQSTKNLEQQLVNLGITEKNLNVETSQRNKALEVAQKELDKLEQEIVAIAKKNEYTDEQTELAKKSSKWLWFQRVSPIITSLIGGASIILAAPTGGATIPLAAGLLGAGMLKSSSVQQPSWNANSEVFY
ncbi:hypothetical protein [Capybara microvirus Cap3_SP_393]|nr:hypothetical protein [Capybara microvirus Cap3_SP_393]